MNLRTEVSGTGYKKAGQPANLVFGMIASMAILAAAIYGGYVLVTLLLKSKGRR